jgi:hypothetical protein
VAANNARIRLSPQAAPPDRDPVAQIDRRTGVGGIVNHKRHELAHAAIFDRDHR